MQERRGGLSEHYSRDEVPLLLFCALKCDPVFVFSLGAASAAISGCFCLTAARFQSNFDLKQQTHAWGPKCVLPGNISRIRRNGANGYRGSVFFNAIFQFLDLLQVTQAMDTVATKGQDAGELPTSKIFLTKTLNLCSIAVRQCSVPGWCQWKWQHVHLMCYRSFAASLFLTDVYISLPLTETFKRCGTL